MNILSVSPSVHLNCPHTAQIIKITIILHVKFASYVFQEQTLVSLLADELLTVCRLHPSMHFQQVLSQELLYLFSLLYLWYKKYTSSPKIRIFLYFHSENKDDFVATKF